MNEVMTTVSQDEAIAIICACKMDDLVSEMKAGIGGTVKECRTKLFRAWGYVFDTKAWKHGEDAFDGIDASDVCAHAFWCWYTALALDLCELVRQESARLGIALPNGSR